MRRWVGVTFFFLLALGLTQSVSGDLLRLSDGRDIEGVIVQESGSEIRVQVLWRGYVTVERDSVTSITRGSPGAHRLLLKQWRKDYLADQQREKERSAFEATQREKGFVEYQGAWISREALALIRQKEKEKKKEEARLEQEEQTKQITERVGALEEENLRLQRKLDSRPPVIVIREGIVPHPHDHTLYEDEQGNLIRVEEHDGHQFFTTTDGTHVNLESHEGHLSFADQKGVHHDLRLR